MQRIALVLCVLAALVVGVLLTLRSVTPLSSLVATQLGAWRFSSHAGAQDTDPYTRARLFLSGELPVASGQGYTLRAYHDSAGATLNRRCTYRIAAPFPAARYFTLTLTDKDGRLVPNLMERASFTSSEIVRREGGKFDIMIGPGPLSGNWLPTGALPGAFVLDLRFYDTPLSATASQLHAASLPRIEALECAP
jgi:hypothetical protein